MKIIQNDSKVVHSRSLDILVWSLYSLVSFLAVYVWGSQLGWNFSGLDAFTVFPLLGLLAFSLMWVHYVSGYVRDTWFAGQSLKKSFNITSMIVLFLIIVHPALLISQLFVNGNGLPPGSYASYVAPGNTIFVIIGTIGLVALLAFELKRFFGDKSWWKYAAVVTDVGVLLIALHSVQLGQHLQSGWFQYVWYFYIITIIACLVRIYYKKLTRG